MTWQGWLTVLLFLAVVLLGAEIILKDAPRNSFTTESFIFLAFLAITVALVVVISSIRGPKPKWRWGSKPTDNSDEDI